MPNAAGSNPPTVKMLAFAEKIAERLNQPLPAAVRLSFDECKAYLDVNGSLPPTEKALAFARLIANKAKVCLTEEALTSGKALSAWINEHRSAMADGS
jgi:hypothetical protein